LKTANKKVHLHQMQMKRSNVVNNLRKTIKELNTEKKHLQDTVAEYERRLQADQKAGSFSFLLIFFIRLSIKNLQ
jgi:thiamine kinase-like enzyme